jgi:hypothetical protein
MLLTIYNSLKRDFEMWRRLTEVLGQIRDVQRQGLTPFTLRTTQVKGTLLTY